MGAVGGWLGENLKKMKIVFFYFCRPPAPVSTFAVMAVEGGRAWATLDLDDDASYGGLLTLWLRLKTPPNIPGIKKCMVAGIKK